ncbi:GNAT family N-acetyltransferase [Trueperella pecoris]|nr:GNAT family N-acetyltransferase [Trueperella pecoris]QOQ38528.1 GNAT family N-acetyltransferase [Trueperella pecoris]QTG74883.1 GNAT family N-acetyltransferase [Trueperella pecoris]
MHVSTLRTATADDTSAMVDFEEICWRWAYREILPQNFLDCLFAPASKVAIAGYWRNIINSGDPFWLAENTTSSDSRASRIVGIGLANASRDDEAPAPSELSVLYVHPEHQRQGIGTALLDACLGDESAYVWVIKNNLIGEAFYHSHGFEQDGVQRLFDDATPGCHEVRMVRARPE